MIFVNRSAYKTPDFLLSKEVKEAKERIVDLLSSSTSEHLDQLRISFDSDIWLRARGPLRELFKGKCAFCESSLATQHGEVDHYRPRQGGAREVKGNGHLFYSWLAYDWENLLVVCVRCNIARGRNEAVSSDFRVAKERAGVLASIAECRRQEVPYLLDPCFDEPSEHIDCGETGELRALSTRGHFTIAALDLNGQQGLVSARRQAIEVTTYKLAAALDSIDFVVSSADEKRMRIARISGLFDLAQPHQLPRRIVLQTVAANLLQQQDPKFELLRPFLTSADWQRVRAQTRAPQSFPAYSTNVRWGRFPGKRDLPVFHQSRISGISIRNFKGIEALDLDVPEGPEGQRIPGALTLLGENASGKSSVLEAVALASLGTSQIGFLKLDGKAFLRREIRGNVEMLHPAEVRVRLDDGQEVRLRIDGNGRFSGDDQPATVLVGYGPRRFFEQKRNVKRFSAPWHRIRSMFDPTVTLPHPSKWLLSCSQQHFSLAVRALRTLLVLPDQAIVRRNIQEDPGASDILFELDGRIEQFSRLSEGYKTVVAMGVDIMREMLEYWPDLETARGTVLIDELDTHLHPRWKMRIASRLRTALPNVQFLTSTHDPLCLRGYYDGEVQVLRRGEDSRVERVLDLPNVQGLSVQQILTSEFFGLYSAEDPEVDLGVARYAELVAKVNRSPAEETELRQRREEAGRTLRLGSDSKGQLAQEAIGEYLLERRMVSSQRSQTLKREAMSKMLDVWNSLGSSTEPSSDDAEDQKS